MARHVETILLGGGHAHAVALRRLARKPCKALRLTLITRSRRSLYSGMLPGIVRGDYRDEDATLDCGRLAQRAGVRLLVAEAVKLDLEQRSVLLADGRLVGFELLSLDLGGRSKPIPGALAVRPIEGLLPRLNVLDQSRGTIAVVGGGPAGTELALALARRWPGRGLMLLTRGAEPLPGAPEPVRRHALAALEAARIAVRPGCEAVGFGHGRVALADGRSIAAEAALWATGAVGPPLLRECGLALDRLGCVRTDAALRSVSHRFALAAGDCAASDSAPRPKGGVWAVRAGQPLAEALRALAEGRAPPAWHPQRAVLTIMGLGNGRALAWRGKHWLAGRAAWWWKDWLDRRWMRRFR